MEGYIGEIRMFAGMFAPGGWEFCRGQILQIEQNETLFSVIGVSYGGDGRTTFALPDFRGRCGIGAGQGQFLSNRALGEKVGEETVTLTLENMPAHTHKATPQLTGTIRCNNLLSDHESPVGNTLAVFKEDRNAFNTLAPDADMHADTVTVEGSIELSVEGDGVPVSNMQPSLGINYIICTFGSVPSPY
jgi:microcystin-dependent protein